MNTYAVGDIHGCSDGLRLILETLLCARNPLPPGPGLPDRYLVHGHFPQADGLPEILPHRCNLDTGGCTTGVFTCGIFDDTQPDPIDIIQVR